MWDAGKSGLDSLREAVASARRAARFLLTRLLRPETVARRAPPADAPVVFSYRPPPAPDRGKVVVKLCETPLLRGRVHMLRGDAAENLHSHAGIDGFWFVLRGRVRYYGPDDALLAELGPEQGILVPQRTAYRFESVGDEPCELLQVLAYDRSGPVDRRDHAPRNYERRDVSFVDGRRE